MFVKFNPYMITFLDKADKYVRTGEGLEELQEILPAVHHNHQVEYNQYLFSVQGMKKTNEALNVFEDITENFEERKKALMGFEKALAAEKRQEADKALDRIEETTIIIFQAEATSGSLDSKMRLSKFPLLNNLIQASLNVYSGDAPAAVLESRIVMAVNFIGFLEEQIAMYMEIKPHSAQWYPYLSPCIEQLKQGIGAIQIYLEEKNPQNLLAAAHLLQENSKILHSYIETMNAQNEPLFSFSSIPQLERLWIRRYRYAQAALPLEHLTKAIEEVSDLISLHEKMAEEFENSLVSETIKNHYAPTLKAYAAYERDAFNRLTQDDATLTYLKEAIERFAATNKMIAEYVEVTVPNLSEAPNIEELRNIISGVYRGDMPDRILRRVASFLESQLEKDIASMPELPDYITIQKEGFGLIEQYLAVGNKLFLAQALDKIQNATLLLLSDYRQQADNAINSMQEKSVLCVKCGYQNRAGVTHCEYCYSYLVLSKNPFEEKKNLIDLENDDISTKVPENIRKLEELAEQIQTSREAVSVHETVLPILADTRAVLDFFAKRPPEAKEKDEINPAEFIAATKLYASGLEQMLGYDETGDVALVSSAINTIHSALSKFMALSARK